MLTALVAGNMIGSGIFLLPSSLARLGSISLYGWIATTLGAFLLAILFAKMSLWIPKAGGPYAYAEAILGRYMGFQTAYSYWIAIWVGNAAIALAFAGYMQVFIPFLLSPLQSCLLAITAVWIVTLVNIFGARAAGFLQLVTTICKLIPIFLVAIIGWFYFNPYYITQSFNVSGQSNFSAFSSSVSLTLWAFIGVESATASSNAVSNPRFNVPVATLLGTAIAALAYISGSIAIMGMIPNSELAQSSAPFALAAAQIFGQGGEYIVAIGAALSCFGCLNGWVLLQGQIPMNAAEDRLFPTLFAKRNRHDIPANAVILTSVFISLLLLLTISPSLVKQFEIVILIAVLTNLLPYLYTSIAALVTIHLHHKSNHKYWLYQIIAFLAGLYALYAIASCGTQTLLFGLAFLVTSIPLYYYLKKHNQ
ncbi:amino acid permease [uncultured Shewanella sp.]|uniref:amino acid permease n=1 Tax=uncultured Shewanella sp. TaxID=173975 RepID=UPI002628F0C1|nr:amino acid permease [uncultured Shewanella sp.]